MNPAATQLDEQLTTLKLLAVQEHYASLATEAAQKQWPHIDYLARLIDGEALRRQHLTIQRRIAAARRSAHGGIRQLFRLRLPGAPGQNLRALFGGREHTFRAWTFRAQDRGPGAAAGT